MQSGSPESLFDGLDQPATAPPARVDGAFIREVTCRTVLNRCDIGDYSFNCYVGCSHGCGYCYARFMQRFRPHDEPWGEFVDVKINAAEALARQLRRTPPGSVFTCSACDGWQAAERHYELTRRCCRLLLQAGFRLTVLTKSDLVLRDLDILAGRDVCLGVTITTPDEQAARVWEPTASSVAARIEVLRAAKSAGVETSVMFGPLLPELSDTPEALDRLFNLARKADVDRIWTDILNPRPRVWAGVQEIVRSHWPDLLGRYRGLLFDSHLRQAYRVGLRRSIRRAAEAHGLLDKLA
jgi:DNA repair photolyase